MKQADRWTRTLLRDPHKQADKRRRVQAMFEQIAPRYDFLNHLLSFNQDKTWRKRAAQAAGLTEGQTVIDMCCGTGDLVFSLAETQPGLQEIIGVDFAAEMLTHAGRKEETWRTAGDRNNHNSLEIKWLKGDAAKTPLPGELADCITCAFGIRNLQEPEEGISEWYRLLKPEGRVVVLEFSLPDNPLWRLVYQSYFRLVFPLIGGMISKDIYNAYSYLPSSVCNFNTHSQLTLLLENAGFSEIKTHKLTLGTVCLITAVKPGERRDQVTGTFEQSTGL